MDFSQFIFIGVLIIAGTGNGFILKQNETDRKLKIEGGEPISIKKVPYQVFLKVNKKYTCGGALIRPDIVLTSAHCVDLEFWDKLSVIAGTDSTALVNGVPNAKGSVEIFPETTIKHPMYKNNEHLTFESNELGMKYDIAIIKLKESFKMTNKISTIAMPTGPVKEGEELLLTGIGAVDEDLNESSCLKAYKPTVVRCEDYLKNSKPPITNFRGVICHKSFEGHRSRIGDSGSPLVNSRGELAGIHRGTTESGCQIAVDVFYLLDEIKNVVGQITNEIF